MLLAAQAGRLNVVEFYIKAVKGGLKMLVHTNFNEINCFDKKDFS